MPHDFDEQEPSIDMEAVERRGEPRGALDGVVVKFGPQPDGGTPSHPALEVSEKGFFVAVSDPDRYRLGSMHDVTVSRAPQHVRCRVEVVRKEIEPRCGVALRIAHIGPDDEVSFKQLIGL